MNKRKICSLLMMVVFLLQLLMVSAYASQTENFGDSYYKTTILNDYAEFEKSALIYIENEFGMDEIKTSLNDGGVVSNQERFVVYTIVSEIQGNILLGNYCASYNSMSAKLAEGESYFVSLDEVKFSSYNEIKKYTKKDMPYTFDIMLRISDGNIIDLPVNLKKGEQITTLDIQKWASINNTEKYKSESKYAVQVQKSTMIVPAGILANLSLEKVYEGDTLIMLDRPMVKYDFGDGKGEVDAITILCFRQEALIPANNLLKKNGKTSKTKVSNKVMISEVKKTSDIRKNASTKSTKIGVLRKGVLVAISGQKGKYKRVIMSGNKSGYVLKDALS